jgi:predicted nucleic-acid-binding protein
MIFVDTNLLLRLILRDDKTQIELTEAFILQAQDCLVSSVAFVEIVWVLEMRGYARPEIAGALSFILEIKQISSVEPEVIAAAIEMYTRGKADFADYVMLAQARVRGIKMASFDTILCAEQKAQMVKVA